MELPKHSRPSVSRLYPGSPGNNDATRLEKLLGRLSGKPYGVVVSFVIKYVLSAFQIP